VIVFQNGARPDIGGQLIFRQADFFTLEVFGLFDPVGAHINRSMAEGARHEGRHTDIRAAALRGLDRKTRQRQFADVEFGMAKGAEEDFFRRQHHAGGVDAIDLDGAVDQRARAVIGSDCDGKFEFGHGNPE
jgi:hypothetical protein